MNVRTTDQLPIAVDRARHRRSLHGHPFGLDEDTWRLRDHGNTEAIVISSIAPYLTTSLLEDVKTVFAALATIRPAGSTTAIFDRFRGFARLVSDEGRTPLAVVDVEHSCRVHFRRNALAHAGKSGRRVVSAFVATAFAQNDAESAKQQ